MERHPIVREHRVRLRGLGIIIEDEHLDPRIGEPAGEGVEFGQGPGLDVGVRGRMREDVRSRGLGVEAERGGANEQHGARGLRFVRMLHNFG